MLVAADEWGFDPQTWICPNFCIHLKRVKFTLNEHINWASLFTICELRQQTTGSLLWLCTLWERRDYQNRKMFLLLFVLLTVLLLSRFCSLRPLRASSPTSTFPEPAKVPGMSGQHDTLQLHTKIAQLSETPAHIVAAKQVPISVQISNSGTK